MKNPENTYKNTATEKQLELIEKIETESRSLINLANTMSRAAELVGKKAFGKYTLPLIDCLANTMTQTHYDPSSWITEVLGEKRGLENRVNRELDNDSRREKPIHSHK